MRTAAQSLKIADEVSVFGAITDRRLAGIRVVLAAAALTAIYIDPAEPDRYVNLTYGSLVAYTIYSLAVYTYSRRRENFSWTELQVVTWLDVACYSVLICLSSGTNSVFFFFYTFAIIAASSRGGAKLGLAVTLASAGLFMSLGWKTTPKEQFEWNRFLVRAFSLLSMGYIMAYWGGAEWALKKRLALLKQLSLAANPRFGVDRTIEQMLRRVLGFYDGEYCVLVLRVDEGLHLYRTTRHDPDGACRPTPFDSESQIPEIPVADPNAAVYNHRSGRLRRQASYKGRDPYTQRDADYRPEMGDAIAEYLGVRSFIAAPLRYREQNRGRLIVGSTQSDAFDISDATFLVQVANQILPVVENIRLVDRLASDASEEERRRIARSVHDRVIQPYFGLKIGLQALHQLLESNGGNGVQPENGGKPVVLLKQLMTMTSDGIEELRQYVYGLKQAQSGENRLSDAIRRFAVKFEGATGIQVNVIDGCGGSVINDRLTAEVFQMTSEALSNVCRHTQARSAQVRLNIEADSLVLRVANETGDDHPHNGFIPASISERAEALGGRTDVSWNEGRTTVKVEVPL